MGRGKYMELKIKNKSVTLNKLTPNQLLEHLKFLKLEIVNEVKTYMVGLPLKLCEYIWTMTRAEVKAVELGTAAYKQETFKVRSLAYALVLSTRGQIELTIDEAVQALETDMEAIGKAIAFDVLGFKPEP